MLNKKSKYVNQTIELLDQVNDAKVDSIKKEEKAVIKNEHAKADKKVIEAENKVLESQTKAKKHRIRNTIAVLAAVGMVTTGLVIYNGRGDFNVKNPTEDTHITDTTGSKDEGKNKKDEKQITNKEDNKNNKSSNTGKSGSGRMTKSGAYDAHKKYSTENGDIVDELPQTHEYIDNVPSGNTTAPSTTNVGVKPGEKSAEEAQKETDKKIENQVNNGGQVNQINDGIVVVTTPENTSTPSVENTQPSNTTPSSHVDATNVTPDKSKRIDTSNYVEEPSDEPSNNTINHDDDLER